MNVLHRLVQRHDWTERREATGIRTTREVAVKEVDVWLKMMTRLNAEYRGPQFWTVPQAQEEWRNSWGLGKGVGLVARVFSSFCSTVWISCWVHLHFLEEFCHNCLS